MSPGDQIGDYTIREYIAEGGMSIVYRAEDKQGNLVVVKRLRDEFRFDQQLVDRFAQSARIMQQLRHPHLAKVLDYIEEDGKYYMVEEYLSGGSLSDMLENGRGLPEVQALSLCRDALLGVNYAHENAIIHRDLKPGNLMLNEEGQVKVTDFGIARVFGGPRLTKTGMEMGTPAYMSPEQIVSSHEADHLTDVYAMGVVLYELLTGTLPFDGETPFAINVKVVNQQPIPPRQLNASLSANSERLVLKAMQKRPRDRFSGCAEFALQIDRSLKKMQPPPDPVQQTEGRGFGKTVARHRVLAAVVFLLLLTVSVFLGSKIIGVGTEVPPPDFAADPLPPPPPPPPPPAEPPETPTSELAVVANPEPAAPPAIEPPRIVVNPQPAAPPAIEPPRIVVNPQPAAPPAIEPPRIVVAPQPAAFPAIEPPAVSARETETKPDANPPRQLTPPPAAVNAIAREGELTWIYLGRTRLNEGAQLVIDCSSAKCEIGGELVGGAAQVTGLPLPGVPVSINVIDNENISIVEVPRKDNGYRRMVLRYSRGAKFPVKITWKTLN